jgi:hypothetical protein
MKGESSILTSRSFILPPLAQVRFELTASLVLSESGLPVAYRAEVGKN